MVSSKCYVGTAILINEIYDYLWNKKELYYDLQPDLRSNI